jgi:hypothetical protein
MPLIVDFLLPRQPLSQQAKHPSTRRGWRDYVYGRAMHAWSGAPLQNRPLKFTMVHLSMGSEAGDINNYVKPVQDALCGLIYSDDVLIRDVSAHLRFFWDFRAIGPLPAKLADAVLDRHECVYVAISDSTDLKLELT